MRKPENRGIRYRLKPIMMPNRMPGYCLQEKSLGIWFEVTDRGGRNVLFEGDYPPMEASTLLNHLNSEPVVR
jgi:hypothetical protein